MPAAVVAPWQSCPVHPLVGMETAAPGPSHAVSLPKTPSETFIASATVVLTPYSDSMCQLLEAGYQTKKRPSGHEISKHFATDNGAAIPPNLLALANTESNSQYLRYCAAHEFPVHPARFPTHIPEFFIRFLTDPGDLVLDPFAGSCSTGEVAEKLERRWICGEIQEQYLLGAQGRFSPPDGNRSKKPPQQDSRAYSIYRPGLLWGDEIESPLPEDGGRTRPPKDY